MLDTEELNSALEAIDLLLEKAPTVPSLEFLKTSPVADVFKPEHNKAIDAATPQRIARFAPSYGYEGAVGFWSFVKSLQTAINACLAQGKSLIYFAPQP